VRDRVLISIDLEMTSPRPEAQEIIEVAAVKFQNERIVDSFATLVQPPVPLPLAIQRLTGIQPRDLARAPRIEDVLPRLARFLERAPLVAHTVSSDVGALARNGLVLDNPQLDTFELASIVLPQLESYSLSALVRHFGIPQTTQHRALPDAQVTRQLYLRLLERVEALDLGILREINARAAPLMWPLKALFQAAEDARGRRAGSGGTIRDLLTAKLGAGEASLDAVLAHAEVEPLRPRQPTEPIDVAAVAGQLAPDGALARALTTYEPRAEQTEMLRAVGEALNAGGELVVEAGTGVGKSLAYLAPAASFALRNGERVVVSTNTHNLQEQLLAKDIPDLRRAVGEELRATLLKGRQNYLCFQRWQALRRRADLTMSEILTLIKILVWLPQTETGDVGELNLTDAERGVWSRVNSNAELCSPRRCAAAGRRGCFLQYARERAAGSHVVVVNHALLLSDVAAGGGAVIPEYRYLIVDEAHHLEAQATEQLGYAARLRDVVEYLDGLHHTSADRRTGVANELPGQVRHSRAGSTALKTTQELCQELAGRVEVARPLATGLFAALGAFLKRHAGEARGYDQRTRITRAVRARPGWDAVEAAWDQLAVPLADLAAVTERLRAFLVSLEGQGLPDYDAFAGLVGGAVRFNEELRQRATAFVGAPDANDVYWASVTGGEPGLHVAPLDVGPLLREQLYARKVTTVLTSATLTTDESFAFTRQRLGLDEARELRVGSPFDYARSTMLCLPTDLPEPDRNEYPAALAQSLVQVCRASQGRALVLFTSHTALRQTYQAIRRPLEEHGILVLGHGVDGTPRRHLLQTFKSNPRTVLLGASSFWEGVDVIGEGLSVLAIAKLPFPVPTDPIVAARSELFDDPFNQYSLPITILRFKQGFGRLIRSRTDRGVVICYDRRVLTKGYGPVVLRSLPPASARRLPAAELSTAVAGWLGKPGEPPAL
jgi:Rad3-related DNA helicase/DNA polymerase III epsilon subunit-like protein